jgi:short-subunit dehydrogenase
MTASQNKNLGTALITGASSGIGAVYADRLARRGYDLILVARNRDRLEALGKRVNDMTGRTVSISVGDLAIREDLARIESILNNDDTVNLLVNNAGVAVSGDLAGADPDRLENMIKLNVLAPTRLAVAAATAFVARGRGAIINLSSILALVPERFNAVYGGSKAYLLNLSLRLQQEVAGKGVRVQVVLPGAIRTEMWEKADTPIETLPQEMVMDADDMVDAALAGLDQGETVTIPSLPDVTEWESYLEARAKMLPNLSRKRPADRYVLTADQRERSEASGG